MTERPDQLDVACWRAVTTIREHVNAARRRLGIAPRDYDPPTFDPEDPR